MIQKSVSEIETKNRKQLEYFGTQEKKTMIPRETPYLNRHVRELLKFAPIKPNDRVLEIGCGMGRYTLLFAQLGIRIEGLDLSPVLIEQLRQFAEGRFNIPLYTGDVIDTPDELKGEFDMVLGLFTLHHLHDLSKCFQAMADLLKPGGRLVFLEPNAFNPLFHVQILITPGMSYKGESTLLQMRKKPIFKSLARAGFVDIAATTFGFFPPFLANKSWGQKIESLLERVPVWKRLLPFRIVKARLPES
jgi:SAM-dependent methyltransferase